MFGILLNDHFFNDDGHHFLKTRINLKLFGEAQAKTPFVAKLGVLLADMLALEELFGWKGHHAYKMCVGFQRFAHRQWMGPTPDANLNVAMPHTLVDTARMAKQLATDQSVRMAWDTLADAHSKLLIRCKRSVMQ